MPAASDGLLRAILGPTNTGKTHLAIERMCAHSSGVIGFPLRLLAREVYDRVVQMKGASQVALITGEERIVPQGARYFLCTAESMPVQGEGDMGDVHVEAHADGVGGDEVIDLAALEHGDLGVAGGGRKRAHDHRSAALEAAKHLGQRVNLLGGEGDDGTARRQAG